MGRIKIKTWMIPYIMGYILWMLFFKLNPLHYDMYVMKTDYLLRHSSILGVFKAVFFTGGCWKNARYLVNIINIYFVSYQGIFDLVMPLVFILGVYFSQKAINSKKSWSVAALGLGLFFLVSNGIVGGCYSYSYVLYCTPMFFISLFLYVNSRISTDESIFNKWYKQLGYIVLVYCCACFNEHLSCAFSVIMLWVFFKDRFITKRNNKTIAIATAVSLCQTIYMNMYLIVMQTRPLAQSGGELIDILKRNFRVVILETWLSNPIIIIAFLLALMYSVRKNRIFFVTDICFLMGYIAWFALVFLAGGIDTVSKRTPEIVIPYVPSDLWWLWAALYIFANLNILWQIYTVSETMALAYFAGGCSTVPILVTPNTGWTISAMYVFMIIISTVMLVQREDFFGIGRSATSTVCAIIGIVGAVVFSFHIVRIGQVAREVEKTVDETVRMQIEGAWDIEKDIMYIPRFDARDVFCEGRPDFNSYYMWNFCYSNGLDKHTIIVTE